MEGSGCSLILDTIVAVTWNNHGEAQKASVRIVGVQNGIWTVYFSNKIPKRTRYTSLLCFNRLSLTKIIMCMSLLAF
jgi:hypothetical protein